MTQPPGEWTLRLVLLGFAVGVVWLIFSVVRGGGEDDPAPVDSPEGTAELQTCPDYLEDFGPYREGIDVEYDPTMDWDADGVSCE